jgi:DNA invertase Pin-like site-specific DNA recombinase
MSKKRVEAVAYLRTSSATNVGPDKDSDKRQREAIQVFAKRAGYTIVDEFYDAAVKGADPVQERPGFAALLERIRGNGVRTIIVETANRFARDLIVQETGHRMLKAQGIEIIAADSPGAFVEDTPTATLVRQVLGAVAQFDKAMTVAKLRLARDRIRKRDGKCEGRKSHSEERPEAVQLAKQLHKQGLGYRAISAELAAAGHLNERRRPFHHKSVRAMLGD